MSFTDHKTIENRNKNKNLKKMLCIKQFLFKKSLTYFSLMKLDKFKNFLTHYWMNGVSNRLKY